MKYGKIILGVLTACLAIGFKNHVDRIRYEEMWMERFRAEDKLYEKKEV